MMFIFEAKYYRLSLDTVVLYRQPVRNSTGNMQESTKLVLDLYAD